MQLRWVGAIVIGLVLLTTVACIGGIVLIGVTQSDTPGGDHVAVINVHGQITTRAPEGLFATGGASAERIIDQLEQAGENSSVKAVLLHVDSPGGAVVPSQQIHDAVVRVRDGGTPVVAYFGNSATSGGYYVSAPADLIVANAGTITGSIGVITQVPNLEDLYDKLGIEMQTITTGEYKDMMQPARPLTEEEREIIAEIQEESLDDFVDAIVSGRDLDEEEVRELADGRIFTGQQGVENGLVDELGDYRDAVRLTGELADLGDDPDVREYTQTQDFWDLVLGGGVDGSGISLPSIFDIDLDPRDMYLELKYGG
ncbi:MAG: signal peptide peptidase SppA [Thermomicrobiaceae bacterium]